MSFLLGCVACPFYSLESRQASDPLAESAITHMTPCLLRAQQVDWASPPGRGIDAETGLRRAAAHLNHLYTLAGLLMAGRPDQALLDDLDRGPRYLPEIDLAMLSTGWKRTPYETSFS